MSAVNLLLRVAMVALTALCCRSLAGGFGPIGAIAIWSGSVFGVCGLTGLALSRQREGRVSILNYLAGTVLPFGYRVGNGKLVPIVVVSSLAWVAIGVSAVLSVGAQPQATAAVATRAATEVPSGVLRVLLYLAWLVDGFVFLRVGSQFVQRRHSTSPAMLRFLIGLGAVLLVSVLLVVGAPSETRLGLALAIAGGPPLVVGGGYGIFLAVVLCCGRKLRWN